MSISFVTPWTVTFQLLCPWDFPDKDTEVVCHFLFQGIFPTQRINPRLLHHLRWQTDSLPLSHQEALKRIIYNKVYVLKKKKKQVPPSSLSKNYFSARSQKQVWNFLQIGWSTNTHTTTTHPKKTPQLRSKTRVSSSASFQVQEDSFGTNKSDSKYHLQRKD